MSNPVTRWDSRVKPIGVCPQPGCWDRPKAKDPAERYHDRTLKKERYSEGVCWYLACDRGHTWEVSLMISPESAERICSQ